MAIVKTVKLQWHGAEYVVAVTMALINKIEDEVNLMRLALRLRTGDAPMSQVATVFAHLLAAGGCTVGNGKDRRPINAADVWDGMFRDEATQSSLDATNAATAALSCVFPDVKIRAADGDRSPKKPGSKTATRGKGSIKSR